MASYGITFHKPQEREQLVARVKAMLSRGYYLLVLAHENELRKECPDCKRSIEAIALKARGEIMAILSSIAKDTPSLFPAADSRFVCETEEKLRAIIYSDFTKARSELDIPLGMSA